MPKKTRAIKHTDIDKPWNRKIKTSQYNIDSRPIPKTILIVCEGQTEELYFKSFPVLTLTVEAHNLEGQTKLQLVEATKGIIEQSDKQYEEVWCVFDMDVKRGEKEFADFDNSIHKALELNYKVAYSNDAFELWFYLHYQYTDAKNLRTFYYTELGKLWNINYQKDGKTYGFSNLIYQKLLDDNKSSQPNAIKRAKKLLDDRKELAYHVQNPVTTVYQLVETLNNNLRP